MPRDRKLTPELKAKILGYVRAGNFPLAAARACGVGESTWYDWLRAGRAGEDEEYAELVEGLEVARAACQAGLVVLLRQAAARDWRAALAMLERMYPEEWSSKARHAHTHEVVAPATPLLPPEELARLRQILARVEEGERTGAPDRGDP